MRIVAIGGGELRKLETLPLDKLVVDLTGKARPKALFLPTASGDAEAYVETFKRIYGRKLGCHVSVLRLLAQRPSRQEIHDRIGEADLVYVGGGNTLRMMKRWRSLGVDDELFRAAHKGTVMTGLSAGAICWFQHGHSDSRSFSGKKRWGHIRVRGLGLISLLYCPHYRQEKRGKSLAAMVLAHGDHAVACDNKAAFVVEGERCRAVTAGRNARVILLARNGKRLVRRQLNPHEEGHKLSDLFSSR